VLRRSREEETARKYNAYTKSFDNGLQSIKHIFDHMISPTYKSQSSWDLYAFFVFDRNRNTSEAICDALLAVIEAMTESDDDASKSKSALKDLEDHVSRCTLDFLQVDIPSLLGYRTGLHENLWSSQFTRSKSQGLKFNMEKITISFIDNLTSTFSVHPKSWYFTPDLLLNAFREFASSFEHSLGKEYDQYRQTKAAKIASNMDTLSTTLHSLSISSSRKSSSSSTERRSPARSSSDLKCYNCNQFGHSAQFCPNPKRGSSTLSR
jgi:hypothetical protein